MYEGLDIQCGDGEKLDPKLALKSLQLKGNILYKGQVCAWALCIQHGEGEILNSKLEFEFLLFYQGEMPFLEPEIQAQTFQIHASVLQV